MRERVLRVDRCAPRAPARARRALAAPRASAMFKVQVALSARKKGWRVGTSRARAARTKNQKKKHAPMKTEKHARPLTLETHPALSTAFCAYSVWKTRPSGEKVPTDRSYCCGVGGRGMRDEALGTAIDRRACAVRCACDAPFLHRTHPAADASHGSCVLLRCGRATALCMGRGRPLFFFCCFARSAFRFVSMP